MEDEQNKNINNNDGNNQGTKKTRRQRKRQWHQRERRAREQRQQSWANAGVTEKGQRQTELQFKELPKPTYGIPQDQDFGDTLGPKPSGCARVVYGNINGFPPNDPSNEKALELRKHFPRVVEADLFGGCKANLNWKRIPPERRLGEIFRTENALKTRGAYNLHSDIGRHQQGGTFMMAFGEMATRVAETGVDPRGLG
jgi:hypothetical protein